MLRPLITGSLAAFVTLTTLSPAFAEVVSVQAVMAPQETIRMDFGDGSKRFVLMVRRECNPKGQARSRARHVRNSAGMTSSAKDGNHKVTCIHGENAKFGY